MFFVILTVINIYFLKSPLKLVTHFTQLPQLQFSSEEFVYPSFLLKNLSSESNSVALPNIMLGKQAEALFEAAIYASESFEILGANIQIQGTSETLGELDYIILNKQNNQLIHVELACKFYLFDIQIEGSLAAKWIGPNRKDALEDKLKKFNKKQFPLLHKDATKPILEFLEIKVSEVQQQLCFLAHLFIPRGTNKNNFPAPYQDCMVGYWISMSDFLSEDKNASYHLPTKREWLLPPEETTSWQSYEKTKIAIAISLSEKQSPFVYKKGKDTIEIERFFVVWWS